MENQLGAFLEQKYRLECFGPDGKLKWASEFKNRVPTAGLNKYLDAALKTGLASPLWYVGLVGASITDGAITAAAAILTSASNPFTAADVGSPIIVKGAGAAGADLVTTISAYTSAGQVTLTANAGTTVTGAGAAWGCRAADTMASHAPWVEVTPYSNATRPAFTPGTIASGSVDNSASKAVFTINATSQIYGLFLADVNTKGGTTGTLQGMGVFTDLSRGVASGDTLNATVTCTLTGAA
jgi:hypothetical protein